MWTESKEASPRSAKAARTQRESSTIQRCVNWSAVTTASCAARSEGVCASEARSKAWRNGAIHDTKVRVVETLADSQPAVVSVIASELLLAALPAVPVLCPGSTHERDTSSRGKSFFSMRL